MTDVARACQLSLCQLDDVQSRFGKQITPVERTLGSLGKISPPSNDPRNFILPVLYGATGAAISASDAVKEFSKKIHDIASSGKAPKTAFEHIIKLLMGHKDDAIDAVNGEYINRAGERVSFGIHRLMWGHDIFSIGPDNPFALLIKQEGSIFGGIAQVFRHLVGDTFSKQGLPIPFHSFFDYVQDNGKLGNRLWDIAKSSTNGGDGAEIVQAFGNLFTIKAADIGATGLTSMLCAAHNRVMNRDDEAAANQVRVIAYSSQFFGKATIGVMKTGVPFISWPTAVMTIKEMYSLYRINYRDIAELEKVTKRIYDENARLEAEVFASGRDLVSHARASGYVLELTEFDSRMRSLEDFFDR
ncbi:hypothetical protein [Oleisolibacter albus]|uniref:hypothetical protein n=1 Tax=Oleisolibacter albus TaxID=2171757 RepID=UPI000DF185F3|nr:hypothetical protein [Oleisolibacter albus]